MNKINSVSKDESTNYSLMNKNEIVATFTLEIKSGLVRITNVHALRLPFWIKDVGNFITHRAAPRGREHIKELLVRSGCDNIKGFLDVTHALALTDTFWVKQADSNLSWEKVSLFCNPFNEVVAHTAFDGGMYGDNLSTPSPEYSTNGTFAKCWIRENDQIKLLKRGSSGARNTGLEPYSEFYSSQVADAFSAEHVIYDIRNYNNRLCSVCNCFTNEQYGFVPFSLISSKSLPADIIDEYSKRVGDKQLADMFIFDALILNEDRHKGNFGFIFDTDTYEIVSAAPLFDHNVSLLCYAEKEDFNEKYIKSRIPKLYDSFSDLAKAVLYPDARRRLINMKNFEFEDKSKFALQEWRVKELERIIRNQIKLILD